MIAQWMLYVLVVGVLVALGALAMEGAMRAFRLPQRGVWAAAMVLGLALPAAARWMPRDPAPATADAPDVQGTRLRLADLPASAADDLPRLDLAALDRPLAAGWMALSAAAMLALLVAAAVLERRRRGWRAAEIDGVPVLLSPATGPAVVGLFRSRIVLPAWVWDAEPDVRALLVDHEREHLRAGDPRLLALGLACVALAPWNPAAWYALRRLRLAMEVDCDARVLARRADVRAYGSLLLEVGRRGTGGRLMAAAFSEPVSFLERRIRIMTSPRVRRPWLRASGFGAVALALVAAACETPGPVQTSPTARGTFVEPVRTASSTATGAVASGVRISRAAIDAAVREHYPEVFRAAPTDRASLVFVIGEDGRIERHERTQMRRMGEPGGPLAEQDRVAVRTRMDAENLEGGSVDVVSFSPGQMGPGQVDVVWVRKGDAAGRVAATQADTMRTPAGETMRMPAAEHAEHEITAAQARAYVHRFMPEVARDGTTAEFVWFLADANGEVIRHGDTRTSEALNAQANDLLNVQVFKGESVTINGHEVPVIYARLKA